MTAYYDLIGLFSSTAGLSSDVVEDRAAFDRLTCVDGVEFLITEETLDQSSVTVPG